MSLLTINVQQDIRGSLHDIDERYGSVVLIRTLIIAHIIYLIIAAVGFILLLVLSLGPIYDLGLEATPGRPNAFLIPAQISIVLFVLVCLITILSLKYRNVVILQTQIALNFVLGLLLVIFCFLLYLLFSKASLSNLYDDWIESYQDLFESISETDGKRWKNTY